MIFRLTSVCLFFCIFCTLLYSSFCIALHTHTHTHTGVILRTIFLCSKWHHPPFLIIIGNFNRQLCFNGPKISDIFGNLFPMISELFNFFCLRDSPKFYFKPNAQNLTGGMESADFTKPNRSSQDHSMRNLFDKHHFD